MLQVIEARALKQQTSTCFRVRMSDGLHSYSGCGVANTLSERFEQDGLHEHNGIIRVTDLVRNANGFIVFLFNYCF